jgi:hypothetical protein
LMERPTYVIRQQACSGVGEKSSAKNILHILDQPGRLAISEQPDRLDCTSNVIHLKGN